MLIESPKVCNKLVQVGKLILRENKQIYTRTLGNMTFPLSFFLSQSYHPPLHISSIIKHLIIQHFRILTFKIYCNLCIFKHFSGPLKDMFMLSLYLNMSNTWQRKYLRKKLALWIFFFFFAGKVLQIFPELLNMNMNTNIVSHSKWLMNITLLLKVI